MFGGGQVLGITRIDHVIVIVVIVVMVVVMMVQPYPVYWAWRAA